MNDAYSVTASSILYRPSILIGVELDDALTMRGSMSGRCSTGSGPGTGGFPGPHALRITRTAAVERGPCAQSASVRSSTPPRRDFDSAAPIR